MIHLEDMVSECTRFKYKQRYSRKTQRKAAETALHSELPSLFGVVPIRVG